MAKIFPFVRKIKELYSWYSFAVGVSALFLSGAGLAVGGAVWLIKNGIPGPLALMAGYCTLVGAVYLAIAPVVYRTLKQGTLRTNQAVETESPPNYQIWRNRTHISLGDAACLFAELVPTIANRMRPDVREYLSALIDAARNGQLKFVFRNSESERSYLQADYERSIVDDSTRTTRHELKKFAEKRNHVPKFLQDAD